MIYSCPNCAAALIFDPEQNKLVCHSCDSRFKPEEIDTKYTPTMHMQFHIYTCTACGGEVMVTPTEAATYCIYCGQPVIVFDRVSSQLQPDYIIPFKITREDAVASLRKSMHKKFFVPKDFKEFEIDTLRGIYIPFWLYDIDYHDKQYYSVEKRIAGGMSKAHRGYIKEVRTLFKDFPFNASRALDDDELVLLGQYRFEEKVPFNPGYLSGFYADRYNIDYPQATKPALEKAEYYFDTQIVSSLYKKGYEAVFLSYKSPEAKIQKISYALLPVWFMTFRYHEKPYTLFVNGQTGMAAGTLPIHKLKGALLFMFYAMLSAPPFAVFLYLLYFTHAQKQLTWGIILITVITYLLVISVGLIVGIPNLVAYKRGFRFSRSKGVRKYIKERQEA